VGYIIGAVASIAFFPLLLCVPYYIQTSSAPFPCSPCHLSLLACRSLCIVVCALDICVRPPFSAFCTHITLRRRSRRLRRFKRWVWSPCGTHAALTRPTGRQRGPPCRTHFFFAMCNCSKGPYREGLSRLDIHRRCCRSRTEGGGGPESSTRRGGRATSRKMSP
jgi:hypothetical protein